MKKIIFLCIFTITTTFAQKELWGVATGDSFVQNYGHIAKYDINGENGLIRHSFTNDINGYNPKSKLFMASNGKLYGTTISGGTPVFPEQYGRGVIFEFDIILNKYRVVHSFENQLDISTRSDLIEPTPGILYGSTGSKVYKFNLESEILTYLTGVTDWYITGGLVKAANGYLYCQTAATYCPGTTSVGVNNYGTIIRINMAKNSIQEVYQLSCEITFDGAVIQATLVEALSNKLFGICREGGVYYEIDNFEATGGTLFEFNSQTNTYSKKIDFNSLLDGQMPTDIVNGDNGKLYGICARGGAPVENFWLDGTLFEYDIVTNSIIKLFTFGGNLPPVPQTFKNPFFLMKTTNGHFIGLLDVGFNNGIPFKYDPLTNLVSGGNSLGNGVFANKLTEICRKPSYQEFLIDSFSPEVGSFFSFDVQNDNATTFVWKRGTTVLPTQTTGVLNLPSVTIVDTGTYTCTMTNECGVTVTMDLNINVTNLATETIDDFKKLISLYPNPSKGLINLKFPENRGLIGIKYKIINILGQIVEENNIASSNKSEITIDTSNFVNGVYQLTLFTDKGNWNGKFVKE